VCGVEGSTVGAYTCTQITVTFACVDVAAIAITLLWRTCLVTVVHDKRTERSREEELCVVTVFEWFSIWMTVCSDTIGIQIGIGD
jgi:hypothetical protein